MIHVAVLGAGHWGPHLIKNFDNRQSSRVSWVADADPSRLEQVQIRFPDAKVTTDALVAIADDAVAAVVVATPTSTHYELARAALEHGKHVLVEKPIATSSADADALVDLAARAGRVLMVGHVFVYNAGIRRVKAYIDAKELGRLYYISMVRTNLGPIRTDVNAAWDLAAHDISIADYWLDSTPSSVGAVGGGWINPGIEDAVFATLRYPNEVLVNLQVSWMNPRKARDITVVGDLKMLTWDDMNLSEPIRIYDKGIAEQRTHPAYADTFSTFRASIREGDVTIPKLPIEEPLMRECLHFLECIERGEQPITSGALGAGVVRTLEAMDRSMRDGGRDTPVGP